MGARDSKHRARLGDARVVVSMGWLSRLHPMLKAGLTSGTIMSGGDLICQTIEQRSRTFQADTPPFAVRGVDPAEEASTSGRTSGVVSAVQERMGLANYDLVRTARFFGVGLTLHGPFFKYARTCHFLFSRGNISARTNCTRPLPLRATPEIPDRRSPTADRLPHQTTPRVTRNDSKTLGVIERVVGPARCPRAAAKKVALGHVFLFPSYAFLFNVWMGALEGKGAEGGVRKFMDTWAEVCVAGSVFWPAANMVNFMYCPPKHRVLFLNGGGLFWNAFLSYQNAKSNAKRSSLPLEGIKKHLA